MTGRPPHTGWQLVRGRRVEVPPSVRRFARRARRRRLRAALPWLIVAGVLGLIAAMVGVVYSTSLFGVLGITVSGTTVAAPTEIREAAGVARGTPLARVDTDEVARRVERVPAVRQARVRRGWPATLVITVTERTAVAAVPEPAGGLTGFVGVDAEGVPYLPLAERPPELPLVRLATPGRDDPTTRAALTVLLALPPELRTPLIELVAEAPTRIRLELRDKKTVIWGDATESEDKARVAISLLSGKVTVVDVSAPRVVTVR